MGQSASYVRNHKALKFLRRQLRRRATAAETLLWNGLRNRQLMGRKFKRQYSLGPYILDFYCSEEQRAVELDGSVHDNPWRREYDEERTAFLEDQGIRVIRFRNGKVLDQRDSVLEAIAWHFREDAVL